jgi:cell division protein FtsN
MKNHHIQRGSTTLGFIAGLVAGLVIAVVIAMVVTKSAVPFSQKQAKQGKISEPASAEASDPNKPLYSSASASADNAKAPQTNKSADQADDEPAPARKTSRAERIREIREQDKAFAEKMRPKPSATTAAVKKDSHGEDIVAYHLQTNAYSNPVEAQNERARLALLGFEAKISEANISGTPLFRVRVGPYPNVETMNRMRAKLEENGISTAVVPIRK